MHRPDLEGDLKCKVTIYTRCKCYHIQCKGLILKSIVVLFVRHNLIFEMHSINMHCSNIDVINFNAGINIGQRPIGISIL